MFTCSWTVPSRYWWRPYISHKIMARKPYFHTFDFFSETIGRWCFILCQKIALTLAIVACSNYSKTPPTNILVEL